jgi:signal transduction histidine kinase
MKIDINEANINDLTEYIYTFFKPETDKKGILFSFRNSLLPEEAVVKTDHGKIEAILINLVKNAIKYTHSGTIEFGVDRITEKEPVILEFFVKDSGIGIPKERQEAIFERFIQADITDKYAYQGAGLGLSISKAFVEMLGGEISVESELDKGSVFHFTIPVLTETIKV